MAIEFYKPDLTTPFPLTPVVSAEVMLANMRSALARGLPEVIVCKPHGRVLSIVGGGPSLADTFRDISGSIASLNGSCGWLIDRGIIPGACGVLHPEPHMADVVRADRRVRYFVASICDPALFDALDKAGCNVTLWHPSGQSKAMDDLLRARSPEPWLQIGGGASIGMKWIDLGYVLGYRRFHLHGLDSSFRDGKTHAYPDNSVTPAIIEMGGRKTRLGFLAQVADFAAALEKFQLDGFDPIEFEVFGDGLLQDAWKKWRAKNPHLYRLAA